MSTTVEPVQDPVKSQKTGAVPVKSNFKLVVGLAIALLVAGATAGIAVGIFLANKSDDAATSTTTTTTTGATAQSVSVTFITNLANIAAVDQAAVKTAVASGAGAGISAADVSLELTLGSVVIKVPLRTRRTQHCSNPMPRSPAPTTPATSVA